MANSLLFLPDISGFTKFVQSTEVAHSQHVISELLEVLIDANTQQMELAEIEGDALFFYKEGELLSQEKLLAQIETMFTAFYSHLKLLETNRVCPCKACAMAPDLQLKVVAHCGELQFITVKGNRKPFGQQVIEAHRLLKNSVESDNYALISKRLAKQVGLPIYYSSKLFRFREGADAYDGKEMEYIYALVDSGKLTLTEFNTPQQLRFDRAPNNILEREFPLPAHRLLEYISNYRYRHEWVDGVDEFVFNEDEVTRLGTEHVCVINGKHLDFVTVTKEAAPGILVYGEMTTSPPPFDALYQFFNITPINEKRSHLKLESFWEAKSLLKRVMIALFVRKIHVRNVTKAMEQLYQFTILQEKEPMQQNKTTANQILTK